MAPLFDPTASPSVASPRRANFAFNMHQRHSSQSGSFSRGPISPVRQQHHRRESSMDESWDMGDDTESEYRDGDSRVSALPQQDLESAEDEWLDDFYGPEIEAFAEQLHESAILRPNWRNDGIAGFQLIAKLEKYAEGRLEEYRRLHDELGNDQSEGVDEDHVVLVSELEYWRVERQTWELFGILFAHRLEGSDKRSEEVPETLKHRFGSNIRLREYLLSNDSQFKELSLVLDWLQRNAPHLEPNESQFRGDGGWIYTKESIKSRKRTKSISKFGVPDRRGSTTSESSRVTELDPDATSRQGKRLDGEDEEREQGLLRMIWDLLRTGDVKGAQDICKDFGEWWRAVSLGGGEDSWDQEIDGPDNSDDAMWDEHSPPTKGNKRRELWKRMCYTLSRRTENYVYERAVYGLLCGDIDSVLEVCKTWEDHLFAHLNSLIEGHYSAFLASLGRIPPAVSKFPSFDTIAYHSLEGSSLADGTILPRIIDSLVASENLEEARLPLRSIQGALISRRFNDIITELNRQLSCYQLDPDYSPEDDDLAKGLDVADARTLRVTVHLILVLQSLEAGFTVDTAEHGMAENIIAGYIQFLAETDKFELVALYAAKLTAPKAIDVLGGVMMHLKDEERRREVLRLMETHGIDIDGCLRKLMDQALLITEATYGHTISGKGVVATGFEVEVEEEDAHLISSLEWLVLKGDSLRGDVVRKICDVYLRFLLTGRLAASRQLFEKINSKDIIPPEDPNAYIDGSDELPIFSDPETAIAAAVYVQLENMMGALVAHKEWADALKKRPERIDRTFKDTLKMLFTDAESRLSDVVDSFLDSPRFLSLPSIATIRTIYIPEMVLALNHTYLDAGRFLHKSWFAKTMHLATIVADPEKNVLEAFENSRRLREYVDEIGRASRVLLGAAQEGGRQMEELAIWGVAR